MLADESFIRVKFKLRMHKAYESMRQYIPLRYGCITLHYIVKELHVCENILHFNKIGNVSHKRLKWETTWHIFLHMYMAHNFSEP